MTSECPDLAPQHTTRHHQGGRIILEALENGARGNRIVSADVGCAANCAEDGVGHHPTFQSAGILTATEQHGLRAAEAYSIPDIIMQWPPDPGDEDRNTQLHVIELKYCREVGGRSRWRQHAGSTQPS